MVLIIEVKVVPNAGKHGWIRDASGLLKCYLKSLPERGKANEELVKIIARAASVPISAVTIISGHQARKKVVKIDANISQERFYSAIGVDTEKFNKKQMTIFD